MLIFTIKPYMRKRLLAGMIMCVVLGGGYIIVFSNATGIVAEPARAIVSVFSPNSQGADANSNRYRVYENYDLQYTEKQNPVLGLGFGKQFLQPFILPDISGGDPYYLYIPHNTIYWIWMRMGPMGYFALWYLFGAIIVRGCLLARQQRDPYIQLVAIYIVAITCMEIIVAFADYQLFFYRNVIYLGLLVGVLMKLPILDPEKDLLHCEYTCAHSELSKSDVRSWNTKLLLTESTCTQAHSLTTHNCEY